MSDIGFTVVVFFVPFSSLQQRFYVSLVIYNLQFSDLEHFDKALLVFYITFQRYNMP